MRLSCLQENLSRGLSIAGRAVPSRTTMPILGTFCWPPIMANSSWQRRIWN